MSVVRTGVSKHMSYVSVFYVLLYVHTTECASMHCSCSLSPFHPCSDTCGWGSKTPGKQKTQLSTQNQWSQSTEPHDE